MKKNIHILTAVAVAGLAVSAGWAQSPPPWAGWRGRGPQPGGAPGAGMAPEDANRLKVAEAKAMQSEEVRRARERFAEAERALNEARRSALLQADPSLANVLEKGAGAQQGAKGRMETARGLNLAPEEREKLKKAWAQTKDDPAVKAAREKMRAPGADRRAAFKELAEASRNAALKADPSLEPILKKFGPMMKGRFGGAAPDRRHGVDAQPPQRMGQARGWGHGQGQGPFLQHPGPQGRGPQWRGGRRSQGGPPQQGPGMFRGPGQACPPQGPGAFFNGPSQPSGPWAHAPGWRRGRSAGPNPQGGWYPPAPQGRGPAGSQPRGFPGGHGPWRGRWSM